MQRAVSLSHFLLFFTLRSSSEHEFIWSSDQKIKSAKPSVCLGHSVSVSTIYGQENLKEIAGHFDQKAEKKEKTLFDGGTRVWYVSQHQHSSLLWPPLSRTKALSCTLLPNCVPASAGKVTFIMQYMGYEINYSPVHLQTQMFCWHCLTLNTGVQRREDKECLYWVSVCGYICSLLL